MMQSFESFESFYCTCSECDDRYNVTDEELLSSLVEPVDPMKLVIAHDIVSKFRNLSKKRKSYECYRQDLLSGKVLMEIVNSVKRRLTLKAKDEAGCKELQELEKMYDILSEMVDCSFHTSQKIILADFVILTVDDLEQVLIRYQFDLRNATNYTQPPPKVKNLSSKQVHRDKKRKRRAIGNFKAKFVYEEVDEVDEVEEVDEVDEVDEDDADSTPVAPVEVDLAAIMVTKPHRQRRKK
jgi:hypothetical protein